MEEITFRGFDWSELCEPVTGRKYGDFTSDEDALYAVKQMLVDTPESDVPKTAAMLRTFLKALEDDPHVGYSKPFYKGIRKVKDDGTLIALVAHNLAILWT